MNFQLLNKDVEDENELFGSTPLSSSPMEQVSTEGLYADLELGAPLVDSGVVESGT